MSAAMRTAIARVSTSPKPELDGSSAARNLLLDWRMPMIVASGAMPLNAFGSFGSRARADDTRHDRPVTVAILGAVARRHVIAARDEVGEEPVSRYAGVDDRDGLTSPTGEAPDTVQIKAAKLAHADGVDHAGVRHHTLPLLFGTLRRRRWTRFGQQRIVDRWRRHGSGSGCGCGVHRKDSERHRPK